MQYPFPHDLAHRPTPARTAPVPAGTETDFDEIREAAASDPLLGRLWLQLFDDANP